MTQTIASILVTDSPPVFAVFSGGVFATFRYRENPERDKRVERMLTELEAADVLGISARTLWQLRKDEKVRAVRIGRSVRYDPADLREFIESAKAQVV